MANIKAAISINEMLFARADAVAREMGVSRSEVSASALEEYLHRRKSRILLARIDCALEDDAQSEEYETVQRTRRLHRYASVVEQ